ncbi:MAG TPA: alkaline phosphatase family protein, partial [Candidatus Eisenbacteria bacterium]|nr:alkaline phosphatase family protein [Candidatus Eisenbacteria bacterium]
MPFDADDIVLSLQSAIDRFIRRLRRGGPPEISGPRLLIIQIDGLSRKILDRALAAGYTPFLKSLLRQHGYRLEPMSVGLPTSTPAFQMASMYGVRPDIPGFHYFDRERQTDIHFPRAGHAAYVEKKQSAGRRGILHGGSAYGCIFTGGAENNLFTFTSLTRPSGRGIMAALSPFVVLAWVCAKSLFRTVVELAKALPSLINQRNPRQGRRWLAIKIVFSVWLRGFFTMAVCRDLYAGVPAIYVNYIDYDETAHNFGPQSRAALLSLRRVDRAIRQLWRVTRRVPEHRYQLYVLSDHGQAPCASYQDLSGGRRFEKWIFEEFIHPERESRPDGRSGLAQGIRGRRRGATGLFQQFLNYIDEEFLRRNDPEAYQQDGIRVISAGPNALLYVLGTTTALSFEAVERRLPRLAEKLSESPGVGFVLARSAGGPVCFWRGKAFRLSEDGGPFKERADASLVVQAIADLMAMPSAGDLVIYGIDAPRGHVSFIPEMGTHAGPSPDEMQTFVLHSEKIPFPSFITHPVELYEHFMRYRADAGPPQSFGGSTSGRSEEQRAGHQRSDVRSQSSEVRNQILAPSSQRA